jgi:hypothetical protein
MPTTLAKRVDVLRQALVFDTPQNSYLCNELTTRPKILALEICTNGLNFSTWLPGSFGWAG